MQLLKQFSPARRVLQHRVVSPDQFVLMEPVHLLLVVITAGSRLGRLLFSAALDTHFRFGEQRIDWPRLDRRWRWAEAAAKIAATNHFSHLVKAPKRELVTIVVAKAVLKRGTLCA